MSPVDTHVRNVGFGWDAIDIFLFSNGQKCSPPRKYHLRTDELDWWEATLNYLAKSHYGSSHTAIELYTLSGDKIEGPLELSNGMPCVAVVPPDRFTDAGYEKYLMKASRSWEKRKAKNGILNDESDVKKTTNEPCCPCQKKGQANEPCCPCQKTGQESTSTPKLPLETSDETENNTSKRNGALLHHEPPYTEHAQEINDTLELLYAPSSDKAEDNTAAPSVMCNGSVVNGSLQLPKSIISPTLTIRNKQKRASSVRTSFMKTPTQSPKSPKEDSQIKMLIKRNISKTNEPKRLSKSPNKNDVSQKSPLVPTVTASTEALTLKQSEPATPTKCHTMLAVNNKGLVTDSLPLQDLISDKEIMIIATDTNLYPNIAPEVKSVKLDTFYLPVVDETTDCDMMMTSVHEETQTMHEVSTCEVNTLKCSSQYNSKIKVIPAKIASQSNVIYCDIPLEENSIAVINKGDAVNLKLNIELQNDESNDNKNSSVNCKNVRKVSSLSNIYLKRKSASEPSGEQTVTSAKSLESVICDLNEYYAKVVIVQCSCCGNKTTVPRVETMPVYKDPNGFFILMPNTVEQENPNCVCCRSHQRLCPDKKPMSALCIEELCKPNTSTLYPNVQEVGMVMTITGSMGSQMDERQRKLDDICRGAKRGLFYNNAMALNEDLRFREDYSIFPARVIERVGYGSPGTMSRTLPYHRVDSCTETEWCNILLEAQHHADGRYSFRFPPLEVLKYYSLL